MNLFIDSIQTNAMNISIVGLVLICVAAAFYLVGLIVRIAKLRQASRVLSLFGSMFLCGYTSLFFIDIPGFDVWMVQDFSGLILFIVSALICIHAFVMVIRKR